MMIIEISESKLDKLAENTRKMFKYGEKVMKCIEELSEAADMGERGGYGNRNYGGNYNGGYGNRNYGGGYGNRHEEDEDEDYGDRRGVKGTGPYGRRYR